MKKLFFVFLCGLVAGAALLYLKQQLAFELPAPVAMFPDGARYQGDMENGVIQGEGRMLWPGGDRYTGNFHNGMMHGRGLLQFKNGDVYEGEFTNGAITGTGELKYVNGDRYRGDFKYGRADGTGTLDAAGSHYEGAFRDNHYHGRGKLTDKDGNVYHGEFRAGRFHGHGEFVTADGRRYEGEFVDGEFTGAGIYTVKDLRYEGAFRNWKFHGSGRLTDEDGVHAGIFEDGALIGEGEYTGADGARYQGGFRYGRYHGKGRLVTAAGDVYEGEFRYGEYDGRGTLTYAEPLDDIASVQGVWEEGELVSTGAGGKILSKKALAETALYNQEELLQQQWRRLRDQDPAAIDLYFLGIAGDGDESVFRREVLYVQEYFDRTFGTAGRSMVLINDRKTVHDIPLATATSIRRTLSEIARRMDPARDIFFIYLTSHGSEDFDFTLDQAGIDLPELSAATLAEMLREMPVRWKVIVISACYSGGFIPALRDEQSLIITAAAADRASFGCSDRAEFTYFGEAYFRDALPESRDFGAAFDRAAEIIRQREEAEEVEHSRPQIYKPTAIMEYLRQWQRQGMEVENKKLKVKS